MAYNSPAVSAAAATKVAWAKLTIPPRPVTTMKDMKISASARPWATSPTQNLDPMKKT